MLLGELAERLPDELEATGRHPAARLAVHAGPVRVFGAEGARSDPAVRLTAAMLEAAEFRALSENFPFHPVLCVSPEAFDRLGPGTAPGSWPGGSYRARSPGGTAGSCTSCSPRTWTCPRTTPNC